MAGLMFAQAFVPATVGHWLVVALVVAGIVGIFLVVARQSGVSVPPWILTIFWIVLAVFCGVVAIKFLVGMV